MPAPAPAFTTLAVSLDGPIAKVRLARPEQANAINAAMWQEIRQAFAWIDATPQARVAILSGAGAHFCAGIDLAMLAGLEQRIADADEARRRENLHRLIGDLQDCLSSIERCRKPVLAAIHGACVGGGLDLAACCDMRYVAADAFFSIKEIDLAMVADVGSLQRLPHLLGQGMLRELAYTGRRVGAEEAVRLGLANCVFGDFSALTAAVRQIAQTIAGKSPLAIRGIKEALNYSRDRPVADGLQQVAAWNAARLLSADLQESLNARQAGRPPLFAD